MRLKPTSKTRAKPCFWCSSYLPHLSIQIQPPKPSVVVSEEDIPGERFPKILAVDARFTRGGYESSAPSRRTGIMAALDTMVNEMGVDREYIDEISVFDAVGPWESAEFCVCDLSDRVLSRFPVAFARYHPQPQETLWSGVTRIPMTRNNSQVVLPDYLIPYIAAVIEATEKAWKELGGLVSYLIHLDEVRSDR